MRRLIAALAGLAALVAAAPAGACPMPGKGLMFHSCWGEARLDLRLLPEELPLAPAPELGLRLIVTGAYTARDTRSGGLPKPVGLFVHGGAVVNPNLVRMDGILMVDPATGQPEVFHRERASLDGRAYDLTDLARRRAFAAEAARRGLSVMQSHLLIVDGQPDVAPQEGAPIFLRRILFTDADGFGIWQSAGARSLHDATAELAALLAPRMAINLDMGSYDYCQQTRNGAESGCGVLERAETVKLSNLLVLLLQ